LLHAAKRTVTFNGRGKASHAAQAGRFLATQNYKPAFALDHSKVLALRHLLKHDLRQGSHDDSSGWCYRVKPQAKPLGRSSARQERGGMIAGLGKLSFQGLCLRS
jgi:hypothetical protein